MAKKPPPIKQRIINRDRPRCRCGCGKAAYWPKSGVAYFHSRLCGYLAAVKIEQEKP